MSKEKKNTDQSTGNTNQTDVRKDKEDNDNTGLAIGICLGMSIGMMLGHLLFESTALGMSIGMGLGMCFGLLYDSKKKKDAGNGKENDPAQAEGEQRDGE